RIGCTVGLASPQMTYGIDAKRGVQHGERATDSSKEEAADSSAEPVVYEPYDKGSSEAAENDDGIVPVLPDGNRIIRHFRCVFGISVYVRCEQPPAVTVPES